MKTNYDDKTIVIDDILDDRKFIIPQFQRSVVWKQKKRKEFLRNLRDGEPFGVILIRERDGKYELIDGLQRISTIKDYLNHKYDYLEPKDIPLEDVDDLIRMHLKDKGLAIDDNYVKRVDEEWHDKIFECMKGGLQNYEVMTSLREAYGIPDNKVINDQINKIYADFSESQRLDGLKIMAINYCGPEENIPSVFYNLNTGAVALSKYETYAALWYKTKYTVSDDEIISVVADKYTQLQDKSDLDVDFDEDALRSDGITLFEFCYAMSGIMRSKDSHFDILFGDNGKSTDPIGFEILALLLTDRVNKADQLYPLLKDRSAEFLVDIKEMIVDSLKEITDALEPLLVGLNGNRLFSDNTYLIYHIIVSYIREYYDIDVEAGTIAKKTSSLSKKDFKQYAKLCYLYDCMTDYWRQNRQVSDLQRECSDEKRRQRYWHSIKKEQWQSAVQLFMDTQVNSGKTISQKNKLFIDFLTKKKLESNPQYNKYFHASDGNSYSLDIEHIVPKKRIESHIKDLPVSRQKTYYVSSVGNLCYLTAKDNRSKKEKTLYEYADDRPAYVTDDEFKQCVDYPDKEELSFLDFSNDDFREAYDAFLKSRNNRLAAEFLNYI